MASLPARNYCDECGEPIGEGPCEACKAFRAEEDWQRLYLLATVDRVFGTTALAGERQRTR